MLLALCRCKASKYADILLYFKCFVTQQMHKDRSKRYPNFGVLFFYYYTHYIYTLKIYPNTQIKVVNNSG